MNTRNECIDLLKGILESHNQNFNDLTIIEGERFDYSSSVNLDTGVIKFPLLQEAFLILYELDDGERILKFFLIILMLENDEYELCNELLRDIRKLGVPTSFDSEALYRSILIKQLFILLHECGHYYIKKDEELRGLLYDAVNKMGQFLFQDSEKDESQMESVLNRLSSIHPSLEDVCRELFSNVNYTELNNLYLKRTINIDESAADLFAILALDELFKKEKNEKTYVNYKRSILEAVYFVGSIKTLKRALTLIGDNSDDDYLKIVTNSTSNIYIDQHRFFMLGLIIENIYDEYPISLKEIQLGYGLKVFKYLSKNETIINRYADAWLSGNFNETKQTSRDLLINEIMEYVKILTGLYNR